MLLVVPKFALIVGTLLPRSEAAVVVVASRANVTVEMVFMRECCDLWRRIDAANVIMVNALTAWPQRPGDGESRQSRGTESKLAALFESSSYYDLLDWVEIKKKSSV